MFKKTCYCRSQIPLIDTMASVFCCLAAVLLVNLLCAKQLDAVNKDDLDPNGYVLYCPCMGRYK